MTHIAIQEAAEWQARRLDGTGERRAIPKVGRAPISGLVADEKTARVPDVASGLELLLNFAEPFIPTSDPPNAAYSCGRC